MEQHIIVMGDMNCKIGDLIDGNKEEISKGGKIMIKIIKENNMIILNSLEKCRGKWTISSGRAKSIIDYIMIGEEDENGVESIIIDEKKEKSPYRVKAKKARKMKKKIRKNLGVQTEESERSLQRQRLQMLTRHIEEEKLEHNTRKLVKTVESLQKAPGIISENTFCKFQQKQKNKLKEQKTAMKNKDGELVETEKEVKEVYTEFYKDLLSTSVASTQKEQLAEDNVNKLFRLIEIIAENQEPLEITKDLVEIAIKILKRRKAADEEKWTNEMILEGGDEMVNSITYMFREISVTQQIPNQWKTMRIKLIHKKGSKLLMDNKRGLFLTNILSKLYEKVLDLLTTENVKINEHQCGGRKRVWYDRQHDHDESSNRQ